MKYKATAALIIQLISRISAVIRSLAQLYLLIFDKINK